MIVDSIDTMMLMGLTEEYERARDWIATELSFDRDGPRSTFEVRARQSGGAAATKYPKDHDPRPRRTAVSSFSVTIAFR